MKNTILLCMVMLTLTACSNLSRQKFLGLKGQVESLKESRYTVVDRFGEVELEDLKDVTLHTFNTDGYETKTAHYNGVGNCIFAMGYVYDKDKLKKITFSDGYDGELGKASFIEVKGDTSIYEGQVGHVIVRIKDINLNKYNCRITETGGAATKLESWFDRAGNAIEYKVTENDNIVLWTKSEYKDGNVIQTEHLENNSKEIVSYTYNEYDEIGNWKKRTDYRNGKPEYVVIREIKYMK